jgi:hypothetical protein
VKKEVVELKDQVRFLASVIKPLVYGSNDAMKAVIERYFTEKTL